MGRELFNQVKKIQSLGLEFKVKTVGEKKPEFSYNIVEIDKYHNTGAQHPVASWKLILCLLLVRLYAADRLVNIKIVGRTVSVISSNGF